MCGNAETWVIAGAPEDIVEALAEKVGLDEYKVQEYYHLESDESGHWYVIPDSQTENFKLWVYEEDERFDFDDFRISGHPNIVHFRDFYKEF